jgi:hypothetical protein
MPPLPDYSMSFAEASARKAELKQEDSSMSPDAAQVLCSSVGNGQSLVYSVYRPL